MTGQIDIFCLLPDLPEPGEVTPYLQEMHSNRWFTNFGPLNARFQEVMAGFFAASGSPGLTTQTFSSATSALELTLRAMGLPAGGRVLMPALTFPATALAVINAGLEPVFADVDMASWELMAETAIAAHAYKPLAAVMPVAAFGKPVPTEGWQAFQRETGVPVLIDAAAALGQQHVPHDLTAVFSLHATKPFGVGEGGLVVSCDADLLLRAKSLSNFGFLPGKGVVQQTGSNAKMGEYYAAVGLAQVKRWNSVLERRRKVFDAYLVRLEEFGSDIRLQAGVEDFIPAVFPIYVPGKGKEINSAMTSASIQTRYWYLPLLHEHPALTGYGFAEAGGEANLKVCAELGTGLVGLPFHAYLTTADIDKVCAVLAEVV